MRLLAQDRGSGRVVVEEVLPLWVKVTLFSHLKEYCGGLSEIERELPEGMSVGSLMDGLGLPHGDVGFLLVNGKPAGEESVLREGDIVHLTPVISGG